MQGEILYEEKLKIFPGVDLGLVPEGGRINHPFAGDIRGPIIHGKVDGIDYFLMRPDGVGLLHIHGVITTDRGDQISLEVSGFMTRTPDGLYALKGAIAYQTGSKEFAWLNSTQGAVDGFFDLTKMEVTAKIFKV